MTELETRDPCVGAGDGDVREDLGRRLYEVDHPYSAAEGTAVRHDSFEDLRSCLDRQDPDLDHVYRFEPPRDVRRGLMSV